MKAERNFEWNPKRNLKKTPSDALENFEWNPIGEIQRNHKEFPAKNLRKKPEIDRKKPEMKAERNVAGNPTWNLKKHQATPKKNLTETLNGTQSETLKKTKP